MNVPSISEDLQKRAGKGMELSNDAAIVAALANNLVATGFGQSMLAAGDKVVAVKGMVRVKSQIKGQQQPIEYLAVVVGTDKGVEKLAAFSSLLRRRPGATTNHGIFAEDAFAKAVNYADVYTALVANPSFTVATVERNIEFPFGKASVYTTTR